MYLRKEYNAERVKEEATKRAAINEKLNVSEIVVHPIDGVVSKKSSL